MPHNFDAHFKTNPKILALIGKVIIAGGTVFLTAEDLYERYRGKIEKTTLANWRSTGAGPEFTKIGGIPLYHIDDILKYERKRTGIFMGDGKTSKTPRMASKKRGK